MACLLIILVVVILVVLLAVSSTVMGHIRADVVDTLVDSHLFMVVIWYCLIFDPATICPTRSQDGARWTMSGWFSLRTES
jgi:ABC-type multidrug transport system permease subunit